MSKRKINTLFLDTPSDDDEQVSLMAIHCPLEAFKLIYFINGKLGINLARSTQDVDFHHHSSASHYPLYHYRDTEDFLDFYVVANRSKTLSMKNNKSDTLFPMQDAQPAFLIPERKKVDYFFKIEGTKSFRKHLLRLKTIKQIVAVYRMDIVELKSYKNLIFS